MKRFLSFCLLCVYVLAGNAQPRFGTMPQGAPPVPAPRPAFVPPSVAAPSFGSNGWSSPPPVAAPVQNWAPPPNGMPQLAAPVFGGQGNNLPQTQQMVACHSGGYQPSIPLCQAQDARIFGGGGSAPSLQAPTTGASPQQFQTQPQLAAPQLQGVQNTAPILPPPIQGIPQSLKPPVVVAPAQNTIFPQVVPPTLAVPNTQPSSPLAAPPIQQAPQVKSPAQPGFPKVLPDSLPQAQSAKSDANPYLIAKPQNMPQTGQQTFTNGLTESDRRWVNSLPPALSSQIFSLSAERVNQIKANGNWERLKLATTQAAQEIRNAEGAEYQAKLQVWEKAWDNAKTTVQVGLEVGSLATGVGEVVAIGRAYKSADGVKIIAPLLPGLLAKNPIKKEDLLDLVIRGSYAGKSSSVRMVDTTDELKSLFYRILPHGKDVTPKTYKGIMIELEDGVTVGYRDQSLSGKTGEAALDTIDITGLGNITKIHAKK